MGSHSSRPPSGSSAHPRFGALQAYGRALDESPSLRALTTVPFISQTTISLNRPQHDKVIIAQVDCSILTTCGTPLLTRSKQSCSRAPPRYFSLQTAAERSCGRTTNATRNPRSAHLIAKRRSENAASPRTDLSMPQHTSAQNSPPHANGPVPKRTLPSLRIQQPSSAPRLRHCSETPSAATRRPSSRPSYRLQSIPRASSPAPVPPSLAVFFIPPASPCSQPKQTYAARSARAAADAAIRPRLTSLKNSSISRSRKNLARWTPTARLVRTRAPGKLHTYVGRHD